MALLCESCVLLLLWLALQCQEGLSKASAQEYFGRNENKCGRPVRSRRADFTARCEDWRFGNGFQVLRISSVLGCDGQAATEENVKAETQLS